jgi:hypothetical protein
VWPARRLATLFYRGKITVVMARPLDEIVRLDRRWFRAHPERKHRCRWPHTRELAFCDNDRGMPLVMAIRHLGRGHVVYQPVIFQGVLPKDERSAGILFALAARYPQPVPLISEIDVLRLQRGVAGSRLPMSKTTRDLTAPPMVSQAPRMSTGVGSMSRMPGCRAHCRR